jgi:hypothetical protein
MKDYTYSCNKKEYSVVFFKVYELGEEIHMIILADGNLYVIMGGYVKKKGDRNEYVSEYNRSVIAILCKSRILWSSARFND